MTSVEIEEVTTEDAHPTSAPFRISAKPTKNVLTFKLTATASSAIRALRVRFQALNRNSGQRLYSRGMVCGSGDVCGSPDARSLLVESPFTTPTITVNESEVADAGDGEYDVTAYAMADEGWSS